MGCGGSRLDNRGDMLPSKLRPLLWKRYEDIKRQKNGGLLKDSPNHSKKELLKDGVLDGDNSSQHHFPSDKDRRSISSHEDDVKVAPAPEIDETTTENLKIAKAVESNPEFDKQCEQVKDNPDEATLPAGSIDVKSNEKSTQIEEIEKPGAGSQELASVAPDNDETSEKQDSKHGEDAENKTLEAMASALKNFNETEKDGDKDARNSEQEDKEEGRLSNMDESYICPGSPSFRVYFVESLTTDDEATISFLTVNGGHNVAEKDDDADRKSSSDLYSCEIIESVKSNVLSGSIEKKKGKKRQRLRVIRKGKNLLKKVHMMLKFQSTAVQFGSVLRNLLSSVKGMQILGLQQKPECSLDEFQQVIQFDRLRRSRDGSASSVLERQPKDQVASAAWLTLSNTIPGVYNPSSGINSQRSSPPTNIILMDSSTNNPMLQPQNTIIDENIQLTDKVERT
ncbi:unnamed protein product [Dovyalis caffra]|uniref:Uncharacterized protein n=1 Tax=Dovyalis caffra TaxID=77055 RepID=A0AAV1R0S0_9ROSI|nr:unnamed protein product [Dovyalis caffra]